MVPPPTPWHEYATQTWRAWTALLASDPTERQVQAYLETHPSLVPGGLAELGRIESGHLAFPVALISQPPLQALGHKRPDFMWIATDSGTLAPVLVEIESPQKKWLNRDGGQNAKLTQALGQLQAWRKWFDDADNRGVFLRYYDVPSRLAKRKWAPVFLLIYGRRNERGTSSGADRESEHRAYLRKPDEFHITHDHLGLNQKLEDCMCVRKTGERYVAVSIPPTVRLRRDLAEVRSFIRKPRRAMARAGMAKDRQDYLLAQFERSDRSVEDPRSEWWGPDERSRQRLPRPVDVLVRLNEP